MIARAGSSRETMRWSGAAAAVLAVHAGVVALALTWVRSPEVRAPEPVVMLELPPIAWPRASARTGVSLTTIAPPARMER